LEVDGELVGGVEGGREEGEWGGDRDPAAHLGVRVVPDLPRPSIPGAARAFAAFARAFRATADSGI